jgi:hypothetical protein
VFLYYRDNMLRTSISFFSIVTGMSILICCSKANWENNDLVKTSFSLQQLPTHNDNVMNSYIIETRHAKTIVIDGGDQDEAEYLYTLLGKECKYHVNAWFVSHPHSDHVGALIEILRNPIYKLLKIDTIYGSIPAQEETNRYEFNDMDASINLMKALSASKEDFVQLRLGELISIDSVFFKILGVKNPEIKVNYLNNSSVVMRVYDSTKSVLFTGDLGIEGGNKILDRNENDALISDYVQLSHHGNNGVSKEFYEAVNPKFCLWPTPLWLWENDNGHGVNSGQWQTMIVREWMSSLGVKKNYVMADGLCKIE